MAEPIESHLAAGAPAPRERVRHVEWAKIAESLALVVALVVLCAVFGVLAPGTFLAWNNIATMLGSQSVLVIVTLGLIVPLTAGDLDLSIASVLNFSAMMLAVANVQHQLPLSVAIAASLASGVIAGMVNAAFILYFRIPSLIVTLGTGTLINGLTLWLSGSNTIGGVDDRLVDYVVARRIFGIPLAFYYALALSAALWWFLNYTTLGRRLLFVGRGREVARLSGIAVERIRFASLVASSTLSAAAGVAYVGTTGSADPLSGLSFLLPAFASAFLGATTVAPGRFNAWGSFVAVYFLVAGITGLTILGVETYVQNIFYGGALVLAVALSQLARNRATHDFT